MNLFARKAVVADEDMAPEHRLHRSLGWPHLIALGVGAIVGTGILTLTGVGAAKAGPAVILSFAIEEMVGSWAAEKALFVPGTVPNVSRSGHFGDVGHYTQMIWRTTMRVGCALHRGRSDDYLICRYSPPGNVVGARVP